MDNEARLYAELEARGIAFRVVEHHAVFTVDESRELNASLPGAHTKNLFLKDNGGQFWLVTVPGEIRVDLKSLPAAIGSKRLSFAKAEDLLMDLKNKADATVIQVRKSLEEHGGKVSADVRGKIESALSNLEGKIKGDDKAAIQAAMNELESASMELGKVLYEESKKAGAAPAGGGEAKPGGKDDVIDAEFKVKDEK